MWRLRIHRTATPARARTAMPPTTPPAIAPVFLEPPPPPLPPLLDDVVGVGVGLEGVAEGVGVPVGEAPEVREVRPAVLRAQVSHGRCW